MVKQLPSARTLTIEIVQDGAKVSYRSTAFEDGAHAFTTGWRTALPEFSGTPVSEIAQRVSRVVRDELSQATLI